MNDFQEREQEEMREGMRSYGIREILGDMSEGGMESIGCSECPFDGLPNCRGLLEEVSKISDMNMSSEEPLMGHPMSRPSLLCLEASKSPEKSNGDFRNKELVRLKSEIAGRVAQVENLMQVIERLTIEIKAAEEELEEKIEDLEIVERNLETMQDLKRAADERNINLRKANINQAKENTDLREKISKLEQGKEDLRQKHLKARKIYSRIIRAKNERMEEVAFCLAEAIQNEGSTREDLEEAIHEALAIAAKRELEEDGGETEE